MNISNILSKAVIVGRDAVTRISWNSNSNKVIKWITRIYIGSVAILLLTWYGSWWYKTYSMGMPDLSSLQQFINTTVGSTFITFIAFIAGLFIDTNHNGVPDSIEGKNKVGTGTHCGSSSSGSSSGSSAKVGGIGIGAATKPGDSSSTRSGNEG